MTLLHVVISGGGVLILLITTRDLIQILDAVHSQGGDIDTLPFMEERRAYLILAVAYAVYTFGFLLAIAGITGLFQYEIVGAGAALAAILYFIRRLRQQATRLAAASEAR